MHLKCQMARLSQPTIFGIEFNPALICLLYDIRESSLLSKGLRRASSSRPAASKFQKDWSGLCPVVSKSELYLETRVCFASLPVLDSPSFVFGWIRSSCEWKIVLVNLHPSGKCTVHRLCSTYILLVFKVKSVERGVHCLERFRCPELISLLKVIVKDDFTHSL